MVDSPEYACQLVLVTKLVAVLNARSGETFPALKCWGLNGRKPCARCNREVSRKPKMLKLSSAAVYVVQRCSASSFTPITLYVSTSSHRRTGCMKVRCPSNRRAMNPPSGFAQIRISAKKIAICKTPMLVISLSSEFLRTEKRVDQVNEQTQ